MNVTLADPSISSGRDSLPVPVVESSAAPPSLALAQSAQTQGGDELLSLGAVPARLDTLPGQVLAYLTGFLGHQEIFTGLPRTCSSTRAAIAQTSDGLLKPLLNAQSMYRQTPGDDEHGRLLAQAAIDRAISDIATDPSVRHAWRESLTRQAAFVRQQWHRQPAGHGVALSVANVLAKLGRAHEAVHLLRWSIAEAPAARDLEMQHVLLADVLLMTHDAEQAVASADKAIELAAANHRLSAAALVAKAKAALLAGGGAIQPLSAALEMLQAAPDSPLEILPMIAMVQHALGQHAESAATLNRLIAGFPDQAGCIAEVYAWCGNSELAFEWLNKVVRSKNDVVLGRLPQSPLVPPAVRRDHRWAFAMNRLHRSPEQLAAIALNIQVPPDRSRSRPANAPVERKAAVRGARPQPH